MNQTFGAFVRQKQMAQGISLRGLATRQVLCGYDSELYYGSPAAVPIKKIIGSHGVSLEYQYLQKNGRILNAASQTDPAHLWFFGPQQAKISGM